MGKILNSPLSFFCVIYDGLSAEAVKPLCFSLALPSILLLSDPNPFHLLVLSNFNQSSRSLSWKRGIWPRFQKTVPFPVSRPQIDSSAAGARPKTMRGIFGTVIWRTHVIWTGHTLWRVTHSAGPKRSTFKRGGRGGTHTPIRAHTFINTPLLVLPGSGQCSGPAPGPGAQGVVQPRAGRRPENTHSQKLIWKLQAFIQMSGQCNSVKCVFPPHTFFTLSVSHTRGLNWLCGGSVFTVLIAGPFKKFRIIFFPLKISVASISQPIL